MNNSCKIFQHRDIQQKDINNCRFKNSKRLLQMIVKTFIQNSSLVRLLQQGQPQIYQRRSKELSNDVIPQQGFYSYNKQNLNSNIASKGFLFKYTQKLSSYLYIYETFESHPQFFGFTSCLQCHLGRLYNILKLKWQIFILSLIKLKDENYIQSRISLYEYLILNIYIIQDVNQITKLISTTLQLVINSFLFYSKRKITQKYNHQNSLYYIKNDKIIFLGREQTYSDRKQNDKIQFFFHFQFKIIQFK
ncbi:hypothetical protein pb186bvf_009262 [Paramecium bursaria]